MLEVILASGNKHKAEEFAELFDSKIIKVSPASSSIEVDETGLTYNENALLKAKAYYDKFKTPTLADDSGLNVLHLPDELGIYSARFGGDIPHDEKCKLLMSKLEGLSKEKRKAHFTCVLCFYINPEEIFFFEGRVDGHIGWEQKGEFGFGYDPIFCPDGHPDDVTLAMLPEWKQNNSHRARASKMAQDFFLNR